MGLGLTARSEAGTRLLEAVASVVPELQARAEGADRDNALSRESFRAIVGAGIGRAFVPTALGGLGVASVHDWTAAVASLARGDGSAAIAMSMHFSATRGLANAYRAASPGDAVHARAERLLGTVAAGEMLVCSTTTERGTDNLHPLTEAVRTEEGWRVTGRKYFVTMSPIATHVSLNVRAAGPDGDAIANVLMPMATPGIVPQEDWDALGMRGSGSQSVVFDGCVVPEDAVRVIGPWGRWSVPVLIHRTVANLPLVGAFLGIAEAAFEIARTAEARGPEPARSGVYHTLAEMEIALATCRDLLARAAERLDDFLASTPDPTLEQGHQVMKDYQCAKWVVNRLAIDVVSHAMDLAGGGGYLSRNPLSRLYRDVRAGPFMQPYSRVDAREYVGRVVLGHYPEG